MDLKEQLNQRLGEALEKYLAAEGVEAPGVTPAAEVPRNTDHGDLATNVAMQLAKPLRRSPMQIAEEFLAHFDCEGLVTEATVSKPGFINFRLAGEATAEVLRRIAAEGADYGQTQTGAGKRVLVEFMSANPTGPLHIGHARNAVVGDVLARLYAATGHEVVREYYFNDAGKQVAVLGDSLRLRVHELLGREVELPEDFYGGAYMT